MSELPELNVHVPATKAIATVRAATAPHKITAPKTTCETRNPLRFLLRLYISVKHSVVHPMLTSLLICHLAHSTGWC
jgi:hypothetical protein